MIDFLSRERVYLWYYFTLQLKQIFPYWVMGMFLGSVISVFVKEQIHGSAEKIGKQGYGLMGIALASLLGIASPLCMYGTIPLAASFSRKGIQDDWLAAFMMSSILLNPQLILYSTALGHKVLTVRLISCFACGILAGVFIRYFYKDRDFFNFSGFGKIANRDTDPNLFMRLLKNVGRNIRATGVYFLAGTALSAAFQRYVPAEWFAGLFGKNEGFGVLMAATIGVPLYVCGGGTIPLLLQWLADGMSTGSAASFMITGPATKITNLGALKIVLGKRHFLMYLGFVMAFSFAVGIIVNLFFGQ